MDVAPSTGWYETGAVETTTIRDDPFPPLKLAVILLEEFPLKEIAPIDEGS